MAEVTNRVSKVVTHLDPDIDDMVAIRVLQKYGEEKYPGVSKASVCVTGGRMILGKNLDQLEEAGILLVGIGGSIFDEHPVNGDPGQPGECAATLVAKHLGLNHLRELKPNLEYALDKNYFANTKEFELAPLVKLAFRHLCHSGVTSEDDSMGAKVFDSTFLFLDAVQKAEDLRLSGRQLPGSVWRSMDDFTAGWLIRTFVPEREETIPLWLARAKETGKSASYMVARELGLADDATLRFILDNGASNRTVNSAQNPSYELAYLVELVQKLRCIGIRDEEEIKKISMAVDIFLTAMWKKDTNFLVNCRQDWESPDTRPHTITRGKRSILITSVVSSNPEIAKFCRSKHGNRASVVIKRDPDTSNTQVFFDRSANLNVARVAAQLRIAERELNGKPGKGYTFEELMTKGNDIDGAEVWYFDGHQVMNGSLTTHTPPTKLTREQVEEIVVAEVKRQV